MRLQTLIHLQAVAVLVNLVNAMLVITQGSLALLFLVIAALLILNMVLSVRALALSPFQSFPKPPKKGSK